MIYKKKIEIKETD
jgi:hypothetical protein